MMFLLAATLTGAVVTFAGLLPYGFLTAAISMPVGGSLAAFLAGFFLDVKGSRRKCRAEAESDARRKLVA
jgi:hypothetical protein